MNYIIYGLGYFLLTIVITVYNIKISRLYIQVTDCGDDGEAVEERGRKGPGAVGHRFRAVLAVVQRLVVVFAVVAVVDELDDLLLEQLHLDGDRLVPQARVEHVQLVRYVPQIHDGVLAGAHDVFVAALLVLRLDGHKGESAHDDVTHHQAADANVTEQEGHQLAEELFHFVAARIGVDMLPGRRRRRSMVVVRMVMCLHMLLRQLLLVMMMMVPCMVGMMLLYWMMKMLRCWMLHRILRRMLVIPVSHRHGSRAPFRHLCHLGDTTVVTPDDNYIERR